MTYRERREKRAEQRRDWANSRSAKADAAHERVHEIASQIPFGQPILVGHHSQRRAERDQERIVSGMRASVENAKMADRHEQAADEIERQLATSIYDDDADAVEQLQERIARLEAERDRIKAYNASCRKGERDVSLLDAKQQADLASTAKVASYQLGKNGAAPAYWLTNLGGNIRRQKERLERLQREQTSGERGRRMFARFASDCDECGERIEKDDAIVYFRKSRRAIHAAHEEE